MSRRDRLETVLVGRRWDSGEHRRYDGRGRRQDPPVRRRLRRPLLEGTSDEALAAGIGHLEGTAGPGEEGNFALAAHRITHGEPFADLPSLRPGDEVFVDTADVTYTYVVDTPGDALEVSFDAGWVPDALPANPDPDGAEPAQEPGQRLITLTTCAELFQIDERLVVFGHLVGSAPRS